MKNKIIGSFVCMLLITMPVLSVAGDMSNIKMFGETSDDYTDIMQLAIDKGCFPGEWLEQDKLTASDGTSGDLFGYSVSIDGDYAIIGACGDDAYTGSAYVFERDGGSWSEVAKLTASDGEVDDFFGWSVSIDGDYVIIGAIGDDSQVGSAYIFTDLIPDLDCNGSLSWADVIAGSIVNGNIYIENVGDPDSLLDWEITEYPDWGEWTFDPQEGDNLLPGDGPVTVEVSVVAPVVPPGKENEEFTGEVKITNKDNSSDWCVIDVYLAIEDEPPNVKIIKPENALYLSNKKILPFFRPLIIGGIDIEVEASDNISGISRIEFYVDGETKEFDYSEPYSWTWDEKAFFKHTLKVVAFDRSGNIANDEIPVWKFF